MMKIGILNIGGTILGSSRTPFKTIGVMEDGVDKVKEMKKTYRELKLDCLVVLGGNGSQKTANLLREEGLNIIALPKTIDNDLWGTDITFGFQSAVHTISMLLFLQSRKGNGKGKNSQFQNNTLTNSLYAQWVPKVLSLTFVDKVGRRLPLYLTIM